MKIRPNGITTSAVKNFRITVSHLMENREPASRTCLAARPTAAKPARIQTRLSTGVGRSAVAVEALAHLLARFEKRDALLIDRHVRAGARIAAGPRGAMLDRK